jgi:uncharacterized protein
MILAPIIGPITALYAALLGIMFVALSVRTLRLRRRLRIGLGDAGNPQMLRAIRIHANFSEYVPFSLGLIYLTEVQNSAGWLIHALGGLLVFARVAHAYGLQNEKLLFRAMGLATNLSVLLVTCSYLLINVLN